MKSFLISLLLTSVLAYSQDKEIHWDIIAKPGIVLNIPSPLVVKQEGFEDIRLNASYYSEALIFPVYGAIQIGRWADNKLWELESIHHKIFLKNKPPEIKRFTISHGFNMVMINRGWQYDNGLVFRAGLGAVLTHPETEIRGMIWDESNGIFGWGYYVSGPVSQASLAYRKVFWNRVILSAETKFTAAYVNIPIVNGRAHVTNFAWHGLLGVGLRIK